MTLKQSQNLIQDIYGIPDDRLYEIEDLLYYEQKFILRYIQLLRSKDNEGITENLIVAIAWFMALMNRYHFDLEKITWKRYSYKCPFCMDIPCSCSEKGDPKAKKTGRPTSRKPKSLKEWQEVIKKIYPDENINEVNFKILYQTNNLSYLFRNFLHKKEKKFFQEVETQSADCLVLFIRALNVLEIDLGEEFDKFFSDGCYVCHKTPCECNYT
ncbi:hypothetical protein ACFLZS_01580 [Patescibacteria group bacterium]